MTNSIVKAPGKTLGKGAKAAGGTKLVKATGKTVKRSAQYKAAKKAVKTIAKKTSPRTRIAALVGVGATAAAGVYALTRRGGGEDEQQPQAA